VTDRKQTEIHRTVVNDVAIATRLSYGTARPASFDTIVRNTEDDSDLLTKRQFVEFGSKWDIT